MSHLVYIRIQCMRSRMHLLSSLPSLFIGKMEKFNSSVAVLLLVTLTLDQSNAMGEKLEITDLRYD